MASLSKCFLAIILHLVFIESLEFIEGDLPNRAQKLVLEWAALYQQDLLQIGVLRNFVSCLL